MRMFGKAKGGGRRKIARSHSPLLLVRLTTVETEFRAGLIDLSSSGAQLTAPDLPAEGEQIIFRAETVMAFGHVVWSHSLQCGIAFESPLTAAEVNRLRQLANIHKSAA